MNKHLLDGPLGEKYVATVRQMAEQVVAWKEANPTREVLLHFRIPKGVWLTCLPSDGIKFGYLVVNYEGKKMLTELGWLEDKRDAPSFMMAKMAVEIAAEGLV